MLVTSRSTINACRVNGRVSEDMMELCFRSTNTKATLRDKGESEPKMHAYSH